MAAVGDTDLNSIQDNHCNRLLTNLAQMRRSQNLCDLKLECSGTIFAAHRCILSAASPYFKAQIQMLSSENNSNEIIVPVDSSTMVMFLDFIYTGHFALNTNILPAALTAAHLLQFPEIYNYCVQKVDKFMDVGNYTKFWKAAEKCSDKELQQNVIDYCCKNIEKLLEDRSVAKCSLAQIKAIAVSQKLTPEKTMHVVMVWLQHDPTNRKPHLQNLWRDIALPESTVMPLIENGVFNSAPDFVATIRRFFLDNDDSEDEIVNTNNRESSSFDASDGPPLPPRPKQQSQQLRPPRPVVKTASISPQILPRSSANIQPEDEELHNPRVSVQNDSAPEVPRRIESLPPEHEKEPFLLIFAVTRNKRLAVQRYNLQQKKWSPSQDFPLPKQYTIPPVITSIDDNLYILGGSSTEADYDSSVYSYLTSLEEYTRKELCDMLLPRVHCGVTTLNGLLYVVGGRNKTGWLRDVERFNPDLNVWHQMAPLSEPKSALGITVVQGQIYVVGGLMGSKLFSSTTECYDPLADQWTLVTPINPGRYRMGIATVGRIIYVIGGAMEQPQNPDNFLIYDTLRATWETSDSPDMFLDDQPCMLTWNNKVWIVSRRNYCLYCFDPTDYSWNQMETSPAARHWQFIKNVIVMSI